jgi:hypothetical protein
VNGNQVPKIVLTRSATTQYHDESTGKDEKDVGIQKDDKDEDYEEEDYSTSGRLPPPF